MVNEEKLRLMTKIALYEKQHTSDEIRMVKYYKSDYIGLKMIGTAINATIGFILIYGLILIMNAEEFVANLTQIDLISFFSNILISYAFFLIAFMVVAYIIYGYRFRKGRESLKSYNSNLKKMIALLKKEKKERDLALHKEESEEEEDDYDIISL